MNAKSLLFLSVLSGAVVAEAAIKAVTPAMPDSAWAKNWWPKRFAEKKALVQKGGAPYVFIGDSITQLFEKGLGGEIWQKYFGKNGPYPSLNLGYSGDRTEHVLYRIANGELDGYEAKCVVLLIGTNNTGHRTSAEETPADTLIGIKACLDAIRAKQPKAKIVLCSLFPRGATATDELRQRNAVINRELVRFTDGKQVFLCDLTAAMLRPDGTLPTALFPDRLHPSALGYELWANRIIPYFNGFAANDLPASIPDGTYPDDLPMTMVPRTRIPADWWIGKLTRNRNAVADGDGTYDIAMIGDSITHYWEIGEGQDESRDIEILEKKYKILNCGYGGDKIEHLLWRVKYGELDGFKAKLVTLMIGTNNTGDSIVDIARGVRNMIGEIRRKQPQAKILLMGYLPIGEKRNDPRRLKLDALNPMLKTFADGETVIWFDIAEKFLKPDGTTDRAMFDFEYIHPSTEGYRVWREALEPVFTKIIGK